MCSFCHKHGHNVRSCPRLATKLLKAVQTKHSAKQFLEVVSQDTVTVHGVRHKATSSIRSMMKCVHKGSRAMSSSRTQTSSKNRSANERRRLPKRKTLDQEKMDSAMRSDFLKAWKFLTKSFPLPMLTQFIQRFMQMHQPNLLSLCQEVGMSRSRGVMRFLTWSHEIV